MQQTHIWEEKGNYRDQMSCLLLTHHQTCTNTRTRMLGFIGLWTHREMNVGLTVDSVQVNSESEEFCLTSVFFLKVP